MSSTSYADRIAALAGPLVEREGGGPPGWPDQLARFLDLLVDRNRHVNLVSRRTVDRVLEDHVLPSLATLRLVPADHSLRVLDVGTGGGFPGIPLKILRPAIRLDLLDATRKKCDFLQDAIRALDLPETRVHWARIENPPGEFQQRAPFDLAIARAVGGHPETAKAVAPHLSDTGEFWVFVDPSGSGGVPPDPDETTWLPWTSSSGAPLTALRRLLPTPD